MLARMLLRCEPLTTALGGDRTVDLPLDPAEPPGRATAVSKRCTSQRRRDRHDDATLVRRGRRASRVSVSAEANTQRNCARHDREEVLVSRSQRRGKALRVPFNRHEWNLYVSSGRSRALLPGDELNVERAVVQPFDSQRPAAFAYHHFETLELPLGRATEIAPAA